MKKKTLQKNKRPKHDGFVIGRERLRWARFDGHNRLMLYYFADSSVYPERYFHRRFRMGTELFKHIAESVKLQDTFFDERRNCAEDLGHCTYQKVSAAFWNKDSKASFDATTIYTRDSSRTE
jgi:hypothetical protein